MGDGSAASAGLRLGTDSFTIKECVQLINVLIVRYGVSGTIHMLDGKPRIYINAKSKKLLIPIVKPYMHPSMYYKLG